MALVNPRRPTKAETSFRSNEGTEHIAVRMRDVFALAKEFTDLPTEEIEKLLDDSVHEVRVGAVSIMDFRARRAKASEAERRELFELYIRRHDRIDNWDLVDRAAIWVVGRYLYDKSRAPLYELARSSSEWERRSAIVATAYFIREGDLNDTFAIAEVLVDDPHDLVQKAVGGWIREAGKKDLGRLRKFLDHHATTMPRTALRCAIEKLPAEEREHYRDLAKKLSQNALSSLLRGGADVAADPG